MRNAGIVPVLNRHEISPRQPLAENVRNVHVGTGFLCDVRFVGCMGELGSTGTGIGIRYHVGQTDQIDHDLDLLIDRS